MDKQTDTATPLIDMVANGNLAHFDRVEPDAHFAIPARPTVRQQLEYYSRLSETLNEPLYVRLWTCALSLMIDWECEILPDPKISLSRLTNPKVSLDSITDPQASTVIMWAGNVVLQHMNALETLPKV